MTAGALRRTPLYDEHLALGARMGPFAGWEMPIRYAAGTVEEHRAVRAAAGLFDVSHMLRAEVRGPNAAALLRATLTRDARRLPVGRGQYALMCEPDGGIRDDVFVYRLGDDAFLLVGNAANATADLGRLAEHSGPAVGVVSRHDDTAMLALQGPRAAGIVAGLAAPEIAALPPRACASTELGGREAIVARTGYTGEDGFEIVTVASEAPALWRKLIEGGATPCGLGARDTLRLEAALALYGNEIDRTTNPFEAGLGWAVDLDDGAGFVGRDALLALRERPLSRALVCLRAEGRGIMRAGHTILSDDEPVGRVTSGSFSPTLGVGIGMGYVAAALAEPGTAVEIDVRGKRLAALVVPRPFYRRRRTTSEAGVAGW